MRAKARILCIGNDSDLLRTRCAVLEHYGYDAQQSMYSETEAILRAEQFDLVIVSFFMTDEGKAHVDRLIDSRIPTIRLPGLTLAAELLDLVKQHLSRRPET